MKKLLLIALVLNFVACSDDNTENTSTSTAVAKKETFNPEPTPQDYLNAKYPNYMASVESLTKNEKSVTGKTTVTWVSATFPDAALRAALIGIGAGMEDANTSDNVILVDKDRGGLYLQNKGITNLTGIQAFTSLVQLIVSDNLLTTINVSGLANLKWIECQNNQLTSLNLSSNTQLYQVWCQNNLLTSLTLPSSPYLWGVWCYGNQLTTLNLNGNTTITDLFIQGNQIATFNFTSFVNLKQINVSSNKWVSLNFNSNSALTFLMCYSNTLLTDMSIKNNNNFILTQQNFTSNTKSPLIHVDASFLSSANTNWPQKGTSTYVL
jgi:hypothetical protein